MDYLIVIVNNDFQRNLKKSKQFMLEDERVQIIKELKVVDKVFLSIDNDRSVSKSVENIYSQLKNKFQFFFANGGDQNNVSIPEKSLCDKLGITLLDGLGRKIQSSSWLLKNK